VLRGEAETRFVAAEPAACPTLTRGVYRYDFGDTVGLTPLMPMYTLGHDFVPPPVHAGGLRYHGDAPMLCGLVKAGAVEARAFRQNETFDAALRFARTEGIIPAPEPAHAIRAVIDEAEEAREAGEERVILFGLCGHGHFDLAAYEAYLAGELEDLRERGALIAVDDAGSAYAGLHRVMRMRPDIIKLDRPLVSDISTRADKAALVEALVGFAHRTGAAVCAEGIEQLDDLGALADLDVHYGQGYAIARPSPPWGPGAILSQKSQMSQGYFQNFHCWGRARS